MAEISYFKDTFETVSKQSLDFVKYLENIKSGTWLNTVIDYRAGKIDKKKIPAVMPSGFFESGKKNENLKSHSGIICMDCDKKSNPEIISILDELGTDQYIYSFHKSVSGEGLAIYFKIDGKKHLESYFAIEKYLADNYRIIVDVSCKNVSRLRYVSYDADLHINPKAKKWDIFIEKKNIQPSNFNQIYATSDIGFCLSQVLERGINLTESYHDWMQLGFSLATELGEGGRNYFHGLSKVSSKYDFNKCDSKYDNILKHNHGRCTISTFFWLCKQNGIQIKSKETKKIENVGIIRRKSIGLSGGCKTELDAKQSAKRILTEIECIEESMVDEVLDKIFEKPIDLLQAETEANHIEILSDFIAIYNPRLNIITGRTEINGEPITDSMLNTIYLDATKAFPKQRGVNKDNVFSMLNSNYIKKYNPFLDYLADIKHKYKDVENLDTLENVGSCIHLKDKFTEKYAAKLITKWLVSIIASMNGHLSELVLVLISPEQGTGKTRFFRNLLPEKLKTYAADSNLDEGKDDEFLMCEKLIIIDDEFSGKSKKEAALFKKMVSKQQVSKRRAFGRYNEDRHRYAVLGGTANEMDILNDTTGNRRIIPIAVSKIEHERFIEIDKDRLFAELFWLWRNEYNSGAVYVSKEEITLLNENTYLYQEITLEEECIARHFKPSNDFSGEFLMATDMINVCENYLVKQKLYHKKFGQILKKLGYERIKKNGRYGYLVERIG